MSAKVSNADFRKLIAQQWERVSDGGKFDGHTLFQMVAWWRFKPADLLEQRVGGWIETVNALGKVRYTRVK